MSVSILPLPAKEPGIVAATLREALEAEYEEVIVFGFKDGEMYVAASGVDDRLRTIGALEVAKQAIWESPSVD